MARGRARLIGLARLDRDQAGPGLMIPRCSSVHTYGMRFPLHLVYLGPNRELMRMVLGVEPGQVLTTSGARFVVEVVPRGEQGLAGIELILEGASENLKPPEDGEVELLMRDRGSDAWHPAG